MDYVLVGLGNPGKKYALTRHNMGYLVIQTLAHEQGLVFKEESPFEAQVTKGKIGDVTVHLILPLTYMNESGRAVRRYMDFYKVPSSHVRVVSDDSALDFGEMRVRTIGSSGGHNGLKSIQAHLGTQHYVRLRMGIGRGIVERTLSEHVLDEFTPEERQQLPAVLESGKNVLKRLITDDVSLIMNAINARKC